MTRFAAANVINLFDFYLAVMALFSFLRRYEVYRETFLLLVALRGRWPRLMERVNRHRGLILNWPTLRPAVLAVGLMAVQLVASRMVFPNAKLRVADVAEDFAASAVLLFAAVPMVALDIYFLVRVGRFDRDETEKYLDMAETWAGTAKAKAVRLFTFGRVNPDRMVDAELKKGLEQLGRTVTGSMWWVSAQVALRLACGLSIWAVWAARGHS